MVKSRIVNVALLLVIIVGAVMTISSARRLHGLQTEYERLSRTTGELIVTDPTQIHLRALPTDEPFHFAWRVYLPAGQLSAVESAGSHGSSMSSKSSNSAPREFIARIRFYVDSSGNTGVYSNLGNSSGHSTLGSSKIFQFLEAHRRELEIEQLGASELVRIKPGEHATLLRLRVPDSVVERFRQSISDPQAGRLLPNIYECRLDLLP